MLWVRPLERLVDGARCRPDEVAQELEDPLRLGGARGRDAAKVEPVKVAVQTPACAR